MTRRELIAAVAAAEGLTLRDSAVCVNTLFDSMADTLAKGGRVEIRGFGSFKVKAYRSYQGRNPKTGEIIRVQDKKLPFFKVGKELKERVDSE